MATQSRRRGLEPSDDAGDGSRVFLAEDQDLSSLRETDLDPWFTWASLGCVLMVATLVLYRILAFLIP